jgi:pimeloyl-ACP methyl ester carboxylesterase
MPTRTRIAIGGVVGALSLVGAAAVATAALSVIVARKVIVPPSRREEDVAIRSVDLDAGLIVLDSTADSRLRGEYSFWFTRETGHARIGEIVATTPTTVTRRILGVDLGDLATAKRGRLTGWFYLTPEDLGVRYDDVAIATPLGDAPAWLVPPADGTPGRTWAIHVHGRAVRRPETLRAVPIFRDAGYTSLVVSYRNDGEAPRSRAGAYALGAAEWRDVDAAVAYALRHGAERVILMGWSMGGAVSLQTAVNSGHRDRIAGLILESPVIDWRTVLRYQAREAGMRAPLPDLAMSALSVPLTARLSGAEDAIPFDRLDMVARADELAVPILHSDDDGFVPADASHALQRARPDLVTMPSFSVARHTKLWNYDQNGWNAAITGWLTAQGFSASA